MAKIYIQLASYILNISGPGDDQEVQRLLDIAVKVVEVKESHIYGGLRDKEPIVVSCKLD